MPTTLSHHSTPAAIRHAGPLAERRRTGHPDGRVARGGQIRGQRLRDALTARLQTHPLMAHQLLCMFGVAYYLRSPQTLLRSVAACTLPLTPLTLDALGRHVDLVPFIAVPPESVERQRCERERACRHAPQQRLRRGQIVRDAKHA